MIMGLVVDDGTIFGMSVLVHFEPGVFQLSFVANAIDVQRTIETLSFDIVLLATHLDSREFCRRIRANPLTALLPIISFSKVDDLEEKLRYYQMGTDDFMVAPFDGRELVTRIHAVLHRAGEPAQECTSLSAAGGAVELDIQKKTLAVDGMSFHLTRLEYLLLYHLIRVAGAYVSTEALLEKVWGYSGGTGDPTLVRAQVKNLRRKLQTANQDIQWLRSMPGLGYQVVA